MDDNQNPNAGGEMRPANSGSDDAAGKSWEKDLLERLAFAQLKEARAARRWTIFFRLVTLTLFAILVWQLFIAGRADTTAVGRHAALVEIDGPISAGGNGSAKNVVAALNSAFSEAEVAAVIVSINSPGGSPVQAGMINDEMRRLRQLHPDKPLYVVVGEMCASGGYYVAAGADQIFVNKASILGSIGVLMDGFGFSELMEKVGIERRLLTAGENKGFLDPFSPQTPSHRQHAQSMLDEVHRQFIDVVRAGRGDRLKESPEMFSGLFWSGERAVELGLADGFGTVESVARTLVKTDEIVDYTVQEGLSERVLKRFGAAAGESAIKSLFQSNNLSLR